MASELVVVPLTSLEDPSFDLSPFVNAAYGPDRLGVIGVSGVPGWEETVADTLPLAHSLASLPPEVLKSLEHEDSLYNSGWSFGKEKLGDTPDTKKASFYFNPLSDDPRPDIREKYPWALPANRWPKTDLPELEHRCKRLGQLMHRVVVALAKRIDEIPNLGTKIADELEHALRAKGRLLYYYPTKLTGCPASGDGWIGWHNDSGFLTGLTPDMYFDHYSGEIIPNPEPETAGLWVAARSGELRKVTVPSNIMAIQCGECLQIVSGGKLVATPHCVRPPVSAPNVSRAAMPLFVDSSPEFILASPNGREGVFLNTVKQRVPPLADRWTEGQTFADFLGTSFKAYYEWRTDNRD